MNDAASESWATMPGDLRPSRAHVDVWRVPLDTAATAFERVEALTPLLSDDERERAARFKFDDKRAEFTVTRAALRRVIGVLLDAYPASLAFTYSAMGKPTLDPARLTPDGHAVEFNVSHTTGVALIAVAAGRAVGVDVETLRRDADHKALSERFFAPSEAKRIAALPEAERHAAFFRCWTRKEAYVKAHGGGVAGGLDHFQVSLAPGEPAALVATRPDPREAARWWMADLPVEDPYRAAVCAACAPGEVPALRTWQIP
ncbi:MAG: 4'-phosphopantetheinyl transferase superfamily protein [Phycisphaera sp.]|nr:4'-phosphopantetheinyl transferase superfamily protein [Phycisphaera sp.]